MRTQHPAMTAAERAMLETYDLFLVLLDTQPRAAAALAGQTLTLWQTAAAQPPQQKQVKQHDKSISHTAAD